MVGRSGPRLIPVVAAPGDDALRKALLEALMQGLCAQSTAGCRLCCGQQCVVGTTGLERRDRQNVLLRGVRLKIVAVPKPLVDLLTQGTMADPAVALNPAGTPRPLSGLTVDLFCGQTDYTV
jgi:hypothetical protein